MLKYKHGDRVRVRYDLRNGDTIGGVFFNGDMEEFAGQYVTIDGVPADRPNTYLIKEDRHCHRWAEKMFAEDEDEKLGKTGDAWYDNYVGNVDAGVGQDGLTGGSGADNSTPDAPVNDAVNHPSHYTDGKIEVIDFIEDKKLGFCLGNTVKYVARAGKKDPSKRVEDLQKAAWYLNRQIEKWKQEDKL